MDRSLWTALFHLDVPLLEKIIRPALVYLFLIVGLRLAGKRELAQLNAFDLVVLLTISNTVQNAIIGADNSVAGGLIGATTLLVVNYCVVRFVYWHPTMDRIIEGDALVLIENGQLRHENLKKELITVAELEEAAHKTGFRVTRGHRTRDSGSRRCRLIPKKATIRRGHPLSGGTEPAGRHRPGCRRPAQRFLRTTSVDNLFHRPVQSISTSKGA
jgi:hypothetical protein